MGHRETYPALAAISGVCRVIAVLATIVAIGVIVYVIQTEQMVPLLAIPGCLLCAFWHFLIAEVVAAYRHVAIDTSACRDHLADIAKTLKATSVPMFQPSQRQP